MLCVYEPKTSYRIGSDELAAKRLVSLEPSLLAYKVLKGM